MDIGEMKIKEARELKALFGGSCDEGHPYRIGEKYFIRTVTHHYTGRLIEVFKHELVLEDCAWIADDGRLTEALAKSEFNEVEVYPDGKVIIGRGALLDASLIDKTPRSQK